MSFPFQGSKGDRGETRYGRDGPKGNRGETGPVGSPGQRGLPGQPAPGSQPSDPTYDLAALEAALNDLEKRAQTVLEKFIAKVGNVDDYINENERQAVVLIARMKDIVKMNKLYKEEIKGLKEEIEALRKDFNAPTVKPAPYIPKIGKFSVYTSSNASLLSSVSRATEKLKPEIICITFDSI